MSRSPSILQYQAALDSLAFLPCQHVLAKMVSWYLSQAFREIIVSVTFFVRVKWIPKHQFPSSQSCAHVQRKRPSLSSSSSSHSITGVFTSLKFGESLWFGAGTGLIDSQRSLDSANQRLLPLVWSLTSSEHLWILLRLRWGLAGQALSTTIVIFTAFSLSICWRKDSSGLGMVILIPPCGWVGYSKINVCLLWNRASCL